MIAKAIFMAGTIPFILLGLAHLIYSVLDTQNPRRIIPRNRDLIESMQRSTLMITKETDVWRAWLGFNLSHGLGVLIFGCIYLYLAIVSFENLKSLVLLYYMAPILAFLYVILAKKYWFRIPLVGAGLGCFLLTIAVLIS